MDGLEKFKLDASFCKPRSRIDTFFAKTYLKWWNTDHFTRSIYAYNPTITPQEVLEEYNQSLAEIIKIKTINPLVANHIKNSQKVMILSQTLKTIGLTLLDLRRQQARKTRITTEITREDFQTALENDRMNKEAETFNDYPREPVDDENFQFPLSDGSVVTPPLQHDSHAQAQRAQISSPSDLSMSPGIKKNVRKRSSLPVESARIPDNKARRVDYSETETDIDTSSDYDSDYVEGGVKRQFVAKTQSTELNEIEDGQIDLTKFEETFLAMDPEIMWTLKSGRKVEKVVYEFSKNLCGESYLHSFIINDMDVETKSLFSLDEWNEIFEIKNRPKLDPYHAELLKKYTVNDVKKLRSILLEPFLPNGEEYNRDIHFILDFINKAYQGILRLWEMREDPFDDLKLEGWYQMNVWSRLIDPGFDDMNINVIRGEGMSVASSERKNIKRKLNERKKFGKKGDGIFRLHKGRLEYGAIEAGRKWEGPNGTKYMTDSLKISKMLKDMLDKLITEERNHLLIHELKVIGVLHGANRLQVLTVDHPQGYITRIYRNKVQEVAGRLTNAKPLALVLKEILYARSIITATMDLVDKKDDLNIETFLLDDDNDDGSCTSFTNTVIKTFTTPKKLSTKDMIMKLRNNNII